MPLSKPTQKRELASLKILMAIADVYDALVSKRCYKERMPYDKAYSIIKESMGTHFDPQLMIYFDQCRNKLEQYYDTQDA